MSDISERIVVLSIAVFIAYIIGFVRHASVKKYDPLFNSLQDICFLSAGRKLNNKSRGRNILIIRGGVFAVFVLTATMVAAWAIFNVVGMVFGDIKPEILEIIVLAFVIPCVPFYNLPLFIKPDQNKQKKFKQRALQTLSDFAGFQVDKNDEYAINRFYTEITAISFARFFVPCVFWYIALGIYAALFSMVLSWLWLRFSFMKSAGAFGEVPRNLCTVISWLPYVIASSVFFVSLFMIPSTRKKQAFSAVISEFFSRPESVISGGLGILFGGKAVFSGKNNVTVPWKGQKDAVAKVSYNMLGKALYLVNVSFILFFVVVLSVAI